jgi:hypothetical protein
MNSFPTCLNYNIKKINRKLYLNFNIIFFKKQFSIVDNFPANKEHTLSLI